MTQKLLKKFTPGRGYTKEDWDAVDSPEITDEEFARMRPAREVMPPEFFAAIKKAREEKLGRGRPKLAAPKEAVTLRIEPEVILRFKKSGRNWRAKMQEALKKAAVGL